MHALAPISQQIWDMKYRLKGPDGAPVDGSIIDTWRRVARALAAVEKGSAHWEGRFAEALADFKFLPAGRIIAGAGTDRRVTLFNCFVMGTIQDDMASIFENLKEAALTMQQGGGIGFDFSTLRPKGAPVRGVGADASGPLSFMDVWDAMCRTIMSAGHRRGAMMATLRCDHPDIEAFIEAKREPGRLRMFNLSVLVSDAFMAAVKADQPWTLSFKDVTYKTLSARELWDKIMRATYGYAEPGVIFIDRINRLNNLAYAETISATNPCVPADTWVQTTEGPRQVGELMGRPFGAVVDGVAAASDERGFFATGRRKVLRLSTDEGYVLRLTDNHQVRIVAERTRDRQTYAWIAAGDLRPGQQVVVHDHREAATWAGQGDADQGYLLGLLIGDGTLKDDKAVLSAWPGLLVANGTFERPGIAGVMDAALAAARQQPHRADFKGWMAVPGRGEYRLALAAVKHMAERLGLEPGHKTITPAIERCSAAFYRGFLRGLFDADGSVQGNHEKGVSVRLAQSDPALLRAAQRMLLRLGICSRLYAERQPSGLRPMPDGKGGTAIYPHAAQHELVISGDNLAVFADRIGFADTEKSARLTVCLGQYRRALNRERFVATVATVENDGEEDVFDVAIPGINAFDANGLYVHNCGEQPLPPYGACLLGSINLAQLVRQPFTNEAALDETALDELTGLAVRMLDNAISVSRFPLPAQEHEAQAKRRIGLGITGLADALIMAGQRYGSAEAVETTRRWLARLRRAAYLASAELAAEKGAFPLFDRDRYLAGENVQRLEDDVRDAIAAKGIRNALLTSVAPTGTISLLADNVSSGLEPVFSFVYKRNVLMPDGSRKEEEVSDHAYRLFRRSAGENTALPPAFVDAQHLTPGDHVRMQAAVQEFIDSAVSKTVNISEDMSFAAFKDVYMLAYDTGCKGITTYRPNPVTGAVLETKTAKSTKQTELPFEKPAARPADAYEAGGVVYMTKPLDRPGVLPGSTYKVRWPESDHAIYITINDIIQDSRRRPFEVFINSKNMEHYAWTVALTRMISAVFRRGGDVSFVVEELKAVFDPRGGHWVDGHYVPSLLAAIGDVIEQHLVSIGFMAAPHGQEHQAVELRQAAGMEETGPGAMRLRHCPRCNQPALIRLENCDTCTSCGYSKCT